MFLALLMKSYSDIISLRTDHNHLSFRQMYRHFFFHKFHSDIKYIAHKHNSSELSAIQTLLHQLTTCKNYHFIFECFDDLLLCTISVSHLA